MQLRSSSSQRHRLAFYSRSKSRTHRLDGDIRLYSFSTTASSSDTRSTRVWLEDTHVALRRPRSAQASNERITFVSALNPQNKQGYDVLLFRPPASTGQKARAVTLYEDCWHELDHDTRSKKPYLGVSRPEIHEFDGESLPSDCHRRDDEPLDLKRLKLLSRVPLRRRGGTEILSRVTAESRTKEESKANRLQGDW
jgi:hypothetical protein